jgi:hypothetical protein
MRLDLLRDNYLIINIEISKFYAFKSKFRMWYNKNAQTHWLGVFEADKKGSMPSGG